MFMRVNSKCAHQVRPPLQSPRPLSSLRISLLRRRSTVDALTSYIWLPHNICRMPKRAAKTELLQGTLELLILQVTALGPVHGYAIAQRLNQISREALQVRQGSLYPALHRLEKRGWLRAEWRTTETGREAKFYVLTPTGRKRLDVERTEWRRLAEAIGLVLETAK
jgi:PadR family transcriptional regulator PadR